MFEAQLEKLTDEMWRRKLTEDWIGCPEPTTFLYSSEFINLKISETNWDVVVGETNWDVLVGVHLVMMVSEKNNVSLLIACYESMLSLFFCPS